MKTKEDILGLLYRTLSLTRRTLRPMPSADPSQPAPPPHPHDHKHGEGCGTSFRERGRILIELERNDGLTQCTLAEILNIRPQSLSELVFKLEQEGLVERRTNESNKRAIQVFLSDKGRARLDFIKQERRRFAEEFLAPLSDSELEQLDSLLTKLIDAHLKKESEPQD